MNKIIRNTLILTIITVVSGLCLGLVYEITKEPIAQTQEQAKIDAWQSVFPEAELDDFKSEDVDQAVVEQVTSDLGVKATVDEVCKAGDLGYVITVTDKEGYGGDIQITVGIDSEGTVTGISFLSINETAGLGMRASSDPSFAEQYAGKTTDKFYVSKDGGEGEPIDALSGATITSRAVTGAVNTALGYYSSLS